MNRSNRVIYKVITDTNEAKKALELILRVFSKELPQFKARNITYDQLDKVLTPIFHKKLVEDNMSTIAIEEDTSNVISAQISKDLFKAYSYDIIAPIASLLKPNQAMNYEIQNQLIKDSKLSHEVGKYFELYMGAVHPNYRGQGHLYKLLCESQTIAKENGFNVMYSQLFTSNIQNLFINKLGYKEIFSYVFEDFEYNGEKIYKNIGRDDITNDKLTLKVVTKHIK